MRARRHVVHLLYRFAAGGLENVIVQLVNGLPHDEFRHTIVALTEADSAFIARIERKDVEVIALHKPPGQPFAMYPQMHRLLRRLQPDVLHTCNIAALEFMPVAWLARVPVRIHAEHGWDVADPDGSNMRYRFLRRLYRRFVHSFIVVSAQLHAYLRSAIGIPEQCLHLITNGVDTDRFYPRCEDEHLPPGFPFDPKRHFIIGTVGRIEAIKNQKLLIDAFIALALEAGNEDLRLIVVGAGPLQEKLRCGMQAAGLADRMWLPGSRTDIANILRNFDCFVLPSLAEGTSCTLQEAMACALPIVATDVGGNAALLANGSLGCLVPSDDALAMQAAIKRVIAAGNQLNLHARQAVISEYSLNAMLLRYRTLFGGL